MLLSFIHRPCTFHGFFSSFSSSLEASKYSVGRTHGYQSSPAPPLSLCKVAGHSARHCDRAPLLLPHHEVSSGVRRKETHINTSVPVSTCTCTRVCTYTTPPTCTRVTGPLPLTGLPLSRYQYFPNQVQTGGFGVPPSRRQAAGGGGGGGGRGGHDWGAGGRRLDE